MAFIKLMEVIKSMATVHQGCDPGTRQDSWLKGDKDFHEREMRPIVKIVMQLMPCRKSIQKA